MGFNPVLPQIVVEAALVPAEPVSGAGTFLLDDVNFGILGTDVLGGADVWTDITRFVRSFEIDRQSTRVQGPLYQWQAGTANIVLNNSDGRFDPDNLGPGAPYVSGGVSQVKPMVPVRIRAVFNGVTYYLFRGFADGWQEPATTFAGNVSDWTLAATDAFKPLSNIQLATVASPQGPAEDAGARINRILNLCGWYSGVGPGARQIETGLSPLQGTQLGDYALSLMQLAADCELGQLYIDGTGAVVFRNRHALLTESRSLNSQQTFSDNYESDGNLPVAQIGRADDDTTIGNDIQAQIVGSANLQEVMDSNSIARFLFPRTYQRLDLILEGDSDALAWAQWVLYISATGEDRFDTIVIDPQYQPQDLWPQVLGRDMGDRITGIRTPAPVGAFSVAKQGFIAGINHTWDSASSAWQTTWTMQDASKYGSFMTLDNPVSGQLDNNALAY